MKKDVTLQPSLQRMWNFSTSTLLDASSSTQRQSVASLDVIQYVLIECLKDVVASMRALATLFCETCKEAQRATRISVKESSRTKANGCGRRGLPRHWRRQ